MIESKANLVVILGRATPDEVSSGLAWYRLAHEQAATIAGDLDLDLRVVCAVMAALSPRCQWDRNLRDTEVMCGAYVNGWNLWEVSVQTFNRNKRRAIEILTTGDHNLLSGPKVTAFARCIHDPCCKDVVVDSHAYNAFVGERAISGGNGPRIHKARYIRAADAYSELAADQGVLPMQTQAIVWLVWKRLNNL